MDKTREELGQFVFEVITSTAKKINYPRAFPDYWRDLTSQQQEIYREVAERLYNAGQLAEREACMKAVCGGCRRGLPIDDNYFHIGTTTRDFLCLADNIRRMIKEETQG